LIKLLVGQQQQVARRGEEKKLKVFSGKKFVGKKGEFETFKTTHDSNAYYWLETSQDGVRRIKLHFWSRQ
jgi:hypothetical protein